MAEKNDRKHREKRPPSGLQEGLFGPNPILSNGDTVRGHVAGKEAGLAESGTDPDTREQHASGAHCTEDKQNDHSAHYEDTKVGRVLREQGKATVRNHDRKKGVFARGDKRHTDQN